MFFRTKKSGDRTYLQIAENRWEEGKVKQRVLATLGRLDKLTERGAIDSLLSSGSRFAQAFTIITAHKKGKAPVISSKRIGAAMIFERLWEESGCREVIESLVGERKFAFNVERAVFLTVLHRLFDPGSDRQADKWRDGYKVEGTDALRLHHLYRAMAWLGEERPEEEQHGIPIFLTRTTKDLIEEELFARRRDLFTSLNLVFLDTTSLYFEGEGGDSLGQYGKSRDHRNDRKQMMVAAVIDNQGRPLCCETYPGDIADVNTLVPVVDRLRQRFNIDRVCVVADRGMISQETVSELEERNWYYILGVRMRNQKEVREEVLKRRGRYRAVEAKGQNAKDSSPLKVKDVEVDGRRYVVCLNEDQARKDAADREAILESLENRLSQGDKSLVGNSGYRRYLKTRGGGFEIDEDRVADEARYDGKWVLRTNTKLDASEVALRYKELWMVEALFRRIKSVLSTRPVFHRVDETIIGHVFCSFLSLVLMKELQARIEKKGWRIEWADVIRDLDRLEEVVLDQDGKRFLLRTESVGVCGRVFKAAGVALPPPVRNTSPEDHV